MDRFSSTGPGTGTGNGAGTGTGARPHPLVAGVGVVTGVLDDLAGVDPTFLPPEDKGQLLVQLHRVRQRLHAVELRLIATAEDLAEADGCRDVASWVAPRVRDDHAHAHADQALARALETRWAQVATALRAGDCSIEQARVVVRALDQLPAAELSPGLLEQAEAHLVTACAQHTPRELRRLGDKLLEVIAPEVAENAERDKLDRELDRARRTTRLNFRHRGDGTTDIHARVPDSIAHRLRGYLEAHTAPRHHTAATAAAAAKNQHTNQRTGAPDQDTAGQDTAGQVTAGQDAAGRAAATGPFDGLVDPDTGERITAERARGLALCALLERINPATQPLHGGSATTMMITIELDQLLRGIGVATLPDGSRISAGEARRLACNAHLIPAVLGATSEVLDLGRAQRLYTPAQRRAKTLHHPTCQTRGCTVPATWCEAHHQRPWATGGPTNLKDLALLCPWHHHRAHDPRYEPTWHPDDQATFHRRT